MPHQLLQHAVRNRLNRLEIVLRLVASAQAAGGPMTNPDNAAASPCFPGSPAKSAQHQRPGTTSSGLKIS
ncbi:hypothetical protein WJX82_004608 [Trebouxia sp. C0006]